MPFIQYQDESIPAKWKICTNCNGDGTVVTAVESDSGSISAEEWEAWDMDDRRDYFNGVYDTPCAKCQGAGKRLAPDWGVMTEEARRAYTSYLEARAEEKQHELYWTRLTERGIM